MTYIADGGGARPTVHVPTVTPTKQPVNNTESDAAARAREIQRQIEAMLERLREAQRRAEEARKRAIEAQRKAEQARKAAEEARAQAEKTKAAKDEAAAQKAEQQSKLAEARLKKESAEANFQDKEVNLLKAQVAQKKEQKQSADGKASAEADKKVQDAQTERDEAKRTSDLSNLYADYQEKETKAQTAEAEVKELTPAPGRPSYTISKEESDKFTKAQTDATSLRNEANAAKTKFTDAVGADAGTEFFGSPPPQGTQTGAPTQTTTAALPNDPLHSPLNQLLQVSPKPAWGSPLLLQQPTLSGGNQTTQPLLFTASPTNAASTTGSPGGLDLLPVKDPVPPSKEITTTLNGIADGKSLEQIAKERGVGVDKVHAEAKAAGITLESSQPSTDVHQTTVKRGDATLTYTHDTHSGTVSVKGSFADPSAPGGRKTIDASQDGNGRFTQTVKDDKTGETTTQVIDVKAGTRTEIVVGADGKRTETTIDLTGATVRRPVKPGEGYLDVAKAAGITPEQLLALNPDVDYGKPLKPGQELVVSGVKTTTKTYNPDGTTLEKTVNSDGTQHVVATTKDGRRVTLMGDPDPKNDPAEKIRKGLFEEGKSVAEMAKSLGLTEEQVLAALPKGTVDVTKPTSDNGDVETRTIYDPVTNRVVVETHDWQHDTKDRKVIDDKTVFKVRQYDPETKKYVTVEVKGGLGYLQKQADDKLARVGDIDKQISDLDLAIRYGRRMGESVTELQEQRKQLVAQRDTAKGEADIAQGKATSALIKNQQVKLDKIAANAYQRAFVARPGSEEKKEATKALNDILALVDKVDRLTKAADKDVEFLVADLDRRQKHGAKVDADENLQTQFQKWKDEVWRWAGIPEERAKEMKAEGQRPPGPMYRNAEEENDAAWKAFVSRQEFLDEHGDKTLTDAERPARNAWLQRNLASTAELESNDRYYKISIDKGAADAHVIQGDIDRLQARKDAWVKANPKDFSENFPGIEGEHGGQKELDLLNDQLTKIKVGALVDGKDQKFNQHLMGLSVTDREDPEKLKEISQKYGEDNAKDIERVDQQINDLLMAGTRHRAKVSEAYIQQWAKDNPQLQAKLDELGQTTGTTSVRAAEYRMEQRDKLLSSSHEGLQLKAALSMKYDTQSKLLQVSDGDIARVQKDLDGIDKTVEGQTWLRDVFSDTAEDSQAYTKDQLAKAKQLRDDLQSGKITLTEYTRKQDELMDTYGMKSIDMAGELRDSNETWAVVDDAVRMTVSAAAGIAATIASGGNIAVGIAVGVGVNQLWDTSNDIYAASNGRDIYADGHSSLLTLGGRAIGDRENITGEQVLFTLKDDAVDTAHAVVSATGVSAGIRTSAALTARTAAKQGLTLGPGTTLNIGSRAWVGARAGVVAQGVDGAGRVGVETLHVGLDGQLGTEEGAQRIKGSMTNAVAGLVTAPVTGGVAAAIPLNPNKIFTPTLFAQFGNDAVGSLGTGELMAQMTHGRHMSRAEVIAATLQAFPGTMTNIALHPSRFTSQPAADPSATNNPAQTNAPSTRPVVQVPLGPDGSPMVPQTLGRGRTWEGVANHADRYVRHHDQASQPGSTLRPFAPSASETAVLAWLQQDPAAGSGTVFVVSRMGPADTIYGSSGGVRARNSDTYATFAQARAAAVDMGGAWINRVQPRTDRVPLNARVRVGADEIVGAMHVNAKDNVLPYGIPNVKLADPLNAGSGVPTWKGGIKGALSSEPGNKKINPMQMLGIGVGVRLGAELARGVYGIGLGSGFLGGRVAGVAPGPLSTFGRIAYLDSSQRGKEALAAATVGDRDKATTNIDKVINRTGLRGDKVMDDAKAQKLRDNIGKVADEGEKVQQALRNLGSDAPSDKLFRLHTLEQPADSVVKLWSDYLAVPGMRRFESGLRNESGGDFHGKSRGETREGLLQRLEGMSADQLRQARDDTSDTSPQARLLRAFPDVYEKFHRTAGGRADLRQAQQGLYDQLVSMVGKDGVIDLGAAEGLGGSTNSPNTQLGKFSRRAVILTNVNLAVGAAFKSRAGGDSFSADFANVADFFTAGTAGTNIYYNLKVEKLASVEDSIDTKAAQANQDRETYLAANPDEAKALQSAKDGKDRWNKIRDFAGITSGLRAFGQAALFSQLDFSNVPGGPVVQGVLVGGSVVQGTLTMGWVALQQYTPLRNGNLPNLTKALKWTTAISIVAVPIGSQVMAAIFKPEGEKKESWFESWWKLIPSVGDASQYSAQQAARYMPNVVPSVHPGDPQQGDWLSRTVAEELPQLQPVFVTVDGRDPRSRTLSGVAASNADALFADPALFSLRLEAGPAGEGNAALAQLFNLNPQYNRKLMDGEVTNAPGDPDMVQDGWQVQVGERWASA